MQADLLSHFQTLEDPRVDRTKRYPLIEIIFLIIRAAEDFHNNLDELQQDVDAWAQQYNELRPHSGRYCYGKTAKQTFDDSKHIAFEKSYGRLGNTSDHQTYQTDAVR